MGGTTAALYANIIPQNPAPYVINAMQPSLTGKPATLGFSFWGQWVLVNTSIVIIVMTTALTSGYIPHAVIGWSITGIFISIVQQIYLQRYVGFENWAVFSIIGWVIGVSAGKMAVGWNAGSWDVDWALIGLSVGIAQYFSMRPYVYRAGWWVLASSVALIMAGLLGGATALLEDWFMFKGWVGIDENVTKTIGYIFAGAVGGAVYGAFTGGWFVWLVQNKSRPMGAKK